MKNKSTTKGSNSYLDDLELRLRSAIQKHRDLTLRLTTDLTTSKDKFLEGVIRENNSTLPPGRNRFKRLASLDVQPHAVDEILLHLARTPRYSKTAADFFDTMLEGQSGAAILSIDAAIRPALRETFRLTPRTHITLEHFKSMSQKEMHGTFDSLVGTEVTVQVTKFLWTSNIATLAVTIPEVSDDGKRLPKSENDFQHITVWFKKGTAAVDSNKLPELCRTGQAKSITLNPAFSLLGTVSLWE